MIMIITDYEGTVDMQDSTMYNRTQITSLDTQAKYNQI